MFGSCHGTLLEENSEFAKSCLAEEELVAECQRVESIVPEGSKSVERNVNVLDAAVHATVSELKHLQVWCICRILPHLRHLGD